MVDVPELHVDFSDKVCSMQFHAFFLNTGIHVLRKEKDYRTVSLILPIMGATTDRTTGFQNDTNMINVPLMYYDMVSKVISRNFGRRSFVAEIEKLRKIDRIFLKKLLLLFSSSAHPDYLR